MRCTLLLKGVYEEFESEIKELDDELHWGRGELPVALHWIFAIMEDEGKRASVIKRLGKATKEVVREEGSREIFAVREYLAGGMDNALDEIESRQLRIDST